MAFSASLSSCLWLHKVCTRTGMIRTARCRAWPCSCLLAPVPDGTASRPGPDRVTASHAQHDRRGHVPVLAVQPSKEQVIFCVRFSMPTDLQVVSQVVDDRGKAREVLFQPPHFLFLVNLYFINIYLKLWYLFSSASVRRLHWAQLHISAWIEMGFIFCHLLLVIWFLAQQFGHLQLLHLSYGM